MVSNTELTSLINRQTEWFYIVLDNYYFIKISSTIQVYRCDSRRKDAGEEDGGAALICKMNTAPTFL